MIIPPGSNMAVSVCPDWILLVAAHPENEHCVSMMFNDPVIDVKHALLYMQGALSGKEMPCWKNTSPADWGTVTERSDVHAELIKTEVSFGYATGTYQCKIGGKKMGEFVLNERGVDRIPESFEMGAEYICNSLYHFIWTTVGDFFGNWMWTILGIPIEMNSVTRKVDINPL
jgi:hypothetical protein